MTLDVERLTSNYLDIIDEQIIFLDSDCKVIHFNKAAKKRFKDGVSPFVGKDCKKLCKFRGYIDIEECPAVIAKKTGKKQIAEIETDDGTIHQVIVYPIFEKKEITGYIEISTDISEKKKIEEELSNSRESYRSLVEDTICDWIWEVDVDGVYTYCSPKVSELLGYKPEELVGKTPFDIMPPEEAKRMRIAFSDFTRNEEPFTFFENINLHKNGQIRIMETNGVPIFDSEKKLIGYRGIDRDITTRKKDEEEYFRLQNQFQNILDHSPAVIYIKDKKGKYELVNNKYEELLDMKKEDMLGKTDHDFFPKETAEYFRKNDNDVIKKKESIVFEEEVITQDEKSTYISHKFPLLNHKGEVISLGGISVDITERKNNLEKIQKSEELYRGLIETSPYGIYISDLNGNFEMLNEKNCEILGFDSPDDLIGLNSMDFVAPESKQLVFEALQEYTTTGVIKPIELKMLKKDGTPYYGETISKALIGSDGKPYAFIGIMHDITERKEAMQKLQASEEKYRSLVETTFDIYFEVDKNQKITDFSERLIEITGFKPEELIGKMAYEVTPKNLHEIYRDQFFELIESEQPFTNLEVQFEHKNGQELILEVNALPYFNKSGEFLGYRGIGRDITERKQNQERLKESEEKFRSLVEVTTDWIWEVNERGIYTYSNPKVKDLLGYEPEEIVGEMITKFRTFEEQEKMVRIFMSYVEKKEPFAQIENYYTHKNGQKRIMETSGVPIINSKGELRGYRCVDRDITDRKKSELELQRSEDKYRQLFQNANDGIILYGVTKDNQASNIIDANEILCDISGYTKEEFLSMSPIDLSVPYDSHDLTVTPLIMELKKLTYERMLKTKSGKLIPVEISSHTFELEEENVILAIIRDVSERKDAEVELLESEKKYSTLLYEMTNGFTYRKLIFDEKGQVIDLYYEEVNDNYELLTGKKREEIVGKKFSEIYPEAMKDSNFDWLNELAEVAMTGKPKRFIQYFEDLDGWFDISVFSIEKGYFATAFENVTDRIESLKRIQESEERYRTLVETMNEGLAVIDTYNVFTFVNLKMHDILGYSLEELIGKPITDFLTKENQNVLKNQVKARRKGVSEPYELNFIRKDGTNIATIISPKPLFDSEEKYIGSFAIITDITDQKKAEELRRMAYDQIVNNIQEFANLIDGIRNPLSIIQSTVDLELPQWKEMINTQIKKVESITNQIDLRWSESEQFRNTLIEQLQ